MTFKGKDGSKAEVMLNEEAIEKDMAVAGYNLIVTSEYDMDDQKYMRPITICGESRNHSE